MLKSENSKTNQLLGNIKQTPSHQGLKGGLSNNKNQLQGGSTKQHKTYMKSGVNKSRMKSSTSFKENELVMNGNEVANPKNLITPQFKEMAKTYLTAYQEQQEKFSQKSTHTKGNIVTDSSLRSVGQSQDKSSGSDPKMSSSNIQEKSSFIDSKVSDTEQSEEDRQKQDLRAKQKKKNMITQEYLEEDIPITLRETENFDFLFISSQLIAQDHSEYQSVVQKNQDYEKLKIKKIGSDNYTSRPTQTMNFQPKFKEQQTLRMQKNDVGVQSNAWELYDTSLENQLTESEILALEIKKSIEKELQDKLKNPFCLLKTDSKTLKIHNQQEVPGAREFYEKMQKQESHYSRSIHQKSAQTSKLNTATFNASEKPIIDNNESSRDLSSSINQSRLFQSNTRNRGMRDLSSTGTRKQKLNQIEQNESEVIKEALKDLANQPSEEQQKINKNKNLLQSFKIMERILNQNTYHKQYIFYRNYPEVKIEKSIIEDDANKRGLGGFRTFQRTQVKLEEQDNAEDDQREQSALNLLFSYQCDVTENRNVSSADWNYANNDLLAVSYGEFDLNANQEGMICFWTLKNPSYPERILTYPSRISTIKFSKANPNLIAMGSVDGVVAIYDIRKNGNRPVSENKGLPGQGKHSDVVWEVEWVQKGGKSDQGESLVSISSDGRIVEWSMKKGLEFNNLMNLKRQAHPSKKDVINEGMNFREAAGFSFDFIKGEPSMYLAATEEGTIHRCSRSAEQYLENYFGHSGPVYKVRCNPFFSDIFMTCSADWSCKLWNWREETPINSFQSLDLLDEVMSFEWSPHCSTVFGSVAKDGRLEVWDLAKNNMLDPFVSDKPQAGQIGNSKNIVRFSESAPIIITGDSAGVINTYRLHGYEDQDPSRQAEKLIKFLYPTGYNKISKDQNNF